ncbi:AAA family ATPase [Thermaurantiacus sp.]
MLRVVLSGAESVGKTRLAQRLAAHFGGLWVPEAGRAYTEALDRPLTLEDHHRIAVLHREAADAAAAKQPRVLIEDTDIVMTSAWARMLFGARDPWLAAIPSLADLHLLLLPDVPFAADPVRMFGDPERRARFHAIVEDEFSARGLAPVRIGGDFRLRGERAIAAVAGHLP